MTDLTTRDLAYQDWAIVVADGNYTVTSAKQGLEVVMPVRVVDFNDPVPGKRAYLVSYLRSMEKRAQVEALRKLQEGQ